LRYGLQVRHAVFLPPFDDFADPRRLVELAIAAEESGWDGFFLWDHILRWPGHEGQVGDTWTALAAVAARTSRIRLGPLLTPLPRRRPQKFARESVSLDHLCDGRLTLGVGLGVNTDGELSRFGEDADNRVLAEKLDEALDLVCALWSGDEVSHAGKHYRADAVAFLPRPLQQPRPPLWGAASGDGRPRPLRRAARLDGLFPSDGTPENLGPMLEAVARERGTLDGFDVALPAFDGADMDSFARAGATWALWQFYPPSPADDIIAAVTAGPAARAR
jgi:alkanesulfonate monooxygenase SsuD/methylene tetrahydromethanopterin reductase-like flavin-dependent oxidoreductase (luciferase family)